MTSLTDGMFRSCLTFPSARAAFEELNETKLISLPMWRRLLSWQIYMYRCYSIGSFSACDNTDYPLCLKRPLVVLRIIDTMLASLLFGAAVVAAAPSSSAISVSTTVPKDAASGVLAPFVSFSIEFSSFPDFAGIFVNSLPCQVREIDSSQGINPSQINFLINCWTT